MRLILLLLSAAVAIGAPPVEDPFPKPPSIPSPMPAPIPRPIGSVVNLTPDLFYVFSDENADLLAQPEGLVKITKTPGPITVKGRFADGTGLVETRTLPGPYVYSVDAMQNASGKVYLTLIREARKVGDKVPQTTIDVNGGEAPRPPPLPPVPPKPVDPVTSFRIVFIVESGQTLTAEQKAIVYGKAVEDWMIANCTGGRGGFRRRDKDSPTEMDATMAALWSAIQPKVTTTPCVAIEVNTKVEIVPLGSTPAEMLKTFQGYRK